MARCCLALGLASSSGRLGFKTATGFSLTFLCHVLPDPHVLLEHNFKIIQLVVVSLHDSVPTHRLAQYARYRFSFTTLIIHLPSHTQPIYTERVDISISESLTQSINQSINQPINQSINQSIKMEIFNARSKLKGSQHVMN